MSQHTPEPWTSEGDAVYQGRHGGFGLRNGPNPEADARRIVACVNACEGLSTALLENTVKILDMTLKDRLSIHQKEQEILTAQRDELLTAIKHLRFSFIVSTGDKSPFAKEALAPANKIIAKLEGDPK